MVHLMRWSIWASRDRFMASEPGRNMSYANSELIGTIVCSSFRQHSSVMYETRHRNRRGQYVQTLRHCMFATAPASVIQSFEALTHSIIAIFFDATGA